MNHTPDYISVNRELWDKKTPYHTASDFYKLDDFINGATSLNEPELELLGDVRGKSILHLQCHFGQDSLSLARMGAHVTGVDFSAEAIKKANELNDTLKLDATFICADLYKLPGLLQQQFDIVFSSYGTIVWLPDMEAWAEVISKSLKPGGRFIFVETHPLLLMYDDDLISVKYSYFNTGLIEETESGTYADRNAVINLASMTWNHSLSEVLQALINSGLSLSVVREYDYCPYQCFGNMKEVAPGKFQVIGMGDKAPLLYGLEARKPL